MNFYNTNQEKGTVLRQSRSQAARQEAAILEYYQKRPFQPISPSQLARVFRDWPITSIRRAITNLTHAGRLTKTSRMTTGLYGKKEHYWKLRTEKGLFDE